MVYQRVVFVALLIGVSVVVTATAGQATRGSEVEIETFTYAKAPIAVNEGGLRELRLDLYRPAGDRTGAGRPAVILVHGGAFVGGARDLPENQELARELASRGYVAASIDYRLHGDRPILSESEWGPNYVADLRKLDHPRLEQAITHYGSEWLAAPVAAAEDTLRALDWLRAHADEHGVHPDRVVLLGMSAGAITAMTVVYRLDELGGAAPRLAGVISVRGMMVAGADGASGIPHGSPPLFIVHGTEDDSVGHAEAVRLYDMMREAGVPVELHLLPGRGHELGGDAMLQSRLDDGSLLVERLDRFLRTVFEDPDSLPAAICVGAGDTCPPSAHPGFRDRYEVHVP